MKKNLLPISIFSFAFLWRLLYIFFAKRNDPLFFYPQMDPLYHHQMAISLLNGGWLAERAFFRAPLYPYLLATIYQVFGINLLFPRILQGILGSLSCLLVYLIGKKVFSKKVGIIAGFISGLYPLLIYFDGELLLTNPLIFFTLLAFYLLIKERVFLAGIVFGLAVITRPNILLFLFFLPLYFHYQRKDWLKKTLSFSLAVLIPIIPVPVRNYIKEKDLVLIAWQGGINFYIGNNPKSDGMTAIIPGTRGSWWGGIYDAKRIAESEEKRELKPSEIDRYWFKKGLQFIFKNPIKALSLFLKKSYLFFTGYEISNNRDIYLFAQFTFLKYLIHNYPLFRFPFGLLFPLSLVGIYFSLKEREKFFPFYLFLITYPLSFIIFFVTARYRMLLIPFLILFAVYGLFKVVKEKRRYLPILIFSFAYLFFNFDPYKITSPNLAQSYTTIAIAKKEANQLREAYEWVVKAMKEDPTWVEGLNLLGVILTESGRLNEAEGVFQRSLQLNPNLPETYHNLGNLHYAKNDKAAAKECYRKAISLDPYASRSYNNLGNLYFEEGDLEEALTFYEKAYELEPLFDQALFHFGLAHYYLGNKEKAFGIWQKVLEINPNNQMAREALRELRH